MTLDKAIIEFGSKYFYWGLSFVALSSVRRLCELACHSRIGRDRFKKPEGGGFDKGVEDFHR